MKGVVNKGTVVGECDEGDFVKYLAVDFGTGYDTAIARCAVVDYWAGQNVEFRLDSPTGTVVGVLTLQSTGDWTVFADQKTTLSGAKGLHALYAVFKGANGKNAAVGDFDWFRFTKSPQTAAFEVSPIAPLLSRAISYRNGALNIGATTTRQIVRVCTINGILVFSGTIPPNSSGALHDSDLPAGMYVVDVCSGSEVISRTFVVRR